MPLVTATLAAAEPPANDDFANRIDLGSGQVATNGVNGNATAELDDPTLSDSVVGRSVWWSWTALTSGPVTITLRGSDPDPDDPESQLGVFRGDTLSSLVLIASSTDGIAVDFSRAGLAQVTFEATAGAAYQIEVDGNWTGPGAYTLNVATTRPPIVSFTSPLRDEGQAYFLAGAPIPLAVQAYDVDGRVLRVEYYAPDQNSIVYQLIGIATNTAFSLSWTNAGLSSHSVAAVATDDLGAVGVAVPVEVNVRPLNDDFSHRISVSVTSLTVTGSTLGATHEVDEAQANGNSVWWSWTAPAAGTVTVTTEGALTIGVYLGSTVSNLNQVALATSLDSGRTTRAIFTALAGTTYDIAVGCTSEFGGDVTLQIAQSAPPTVTILTPTNNARYTSGQLVTYSVSAADSDGVLARVEYFRDFEFIGAASNSPFALQLTEDTLGPVGRRLEARAVDDHGVVTRSAEVFYTVYPEPPANDQFANRIASSGSFATVTGSLAYATAEAGEPAELRGHSVWWAWTAPGTGVFTATLVEGLFGYPILAVYTGTALTNLVLLGSDTFTGPGTVPSARVVFEAVAGTTYLLGAGNQSENGGACSLNVARGLPPAVSISSPTNEAILTLGSNVTIQVATSDPDGQVVQVDYFLLDGTPLGSVTNAPFSLTLSDLGEDYYQVYAVATDNEGISTGSASVPFQVLPARPPPPNDDFANRIPFTGAFVTVTGTVANATMAPGEPDRVVWWSWTAPASGLYTFGLAFDVDAGPRPTLAVFTGTDLNNLAVVARSQFDWRNEIYSTQVAFEATAGTVYQVAVGPNGAGYRLRVVPGTRPSISVTEPLNGATIRGTNSFTIRVDASDSDGTIARVDFFLNFQLVATLTNSPYVLTLPLQNLVPESYRLRAKATDDSGLDSSSTDVFLLAYPLPPANDAFANRVVLDGFFVFGTGRLAGATVEPGEPIDSGGSTWWSWTAPAAGPVLITGAGSLHVYRGTTLSNLVPVQLIDYAAVESRFELTFEAEAGSTYQIAAQGNDVQNVAFALVLDARPFTHWQRLESGAFRLDFAGRPGVTWMIEASTNLIDWKSLVTNSAPGGNFDWVDADAAGQPYRFYRARAGP